MRACSIESHRGVETIDLMPTLVKLCDHLRTSSHEGMIATEVRGEGVGVRPSGDDWHLVATCDVHGRGIHGRLVVLSLLLRHVEIHVEIAVIHHVAARRRHELGEIGHGHNRPQVGSFGGDVLHDEDAVDVLLQPLIHPELQMLHRGVVAATHAAAVFARLLLASALVLARVEVRAAEMGRRVVVGAVGLAVAAGFAVREEGAGFADVFADPDAADVQVMAFHVAAEFVVAVEAVGLVVAEAAEGGLALHGHSRLGCYLSFASELAVFTLDDDGFGFCEFGRR